jgi:PII interaction protein X
VPSAISFDAAWNRMSIENYLSHPNLGLLFRICLIGDSKELFATLYAQRLFFLVITDMSGLRFEPIGRADARLLVEGRLRELRRTGQVQEYNQLQAIHKQTFQ